MSEPATRASTISGEGCDIEDIPQRCASGIVAGTEGLHPSTYAL